MGLRSNVFVRCVTLALAAMALAAGAFLVVSSISDDRSAEAATPKSGKVSSASPTLTYKAGPFTVPNTTGAAGEVQCGTATPCDEFKLDVSVPDGYDADHTLNIQIKWPNSAADFDLYMLDANGNVVKSAASSSDPETVILPAVSGSYTIRTVPYAPLGQSFTGKVSLADKGTNPPPSSATPPGYKNYAAPDSLPNSHEAGEPSIGSNWNTGSVMYQAYTSTYRVKFDDSASPAKATFQNKSATPPDCTAATSLDPILETDKKTGRTFESQLAGKTALTCYTDNDGDTWIPTQGSGINSGVDHQTLGGGPFSQKGIGPTTSYPDAVYYCSQDIADASCATSRDGGLTYGPAVPIYDLTQCGGLHGHVKVAPDGTVYVPNKGCGGKQAVAVSTDNGTTWTVRKVPGSTAGSSDPSVGIGKDGTVYFGYQNSDGHARVAVSHDRGQTWEHDQDVGAQLGVKNMVFPATVAGDGDRASFAFLGTKTGGNYEDQQNFDGIWHLYIATTYDGGKSWVTTDATPDDPVQRGSICTGGTTCGKDRNLLDFMDATVDKEGRVLVGYADGCTGACVNSGPNNYDALATIARQTSGKRLFAAYDPKPDLTVQNISSKQSKNHKQTALSATVSNNGATSADGVAVRFLDGAAKISDSTPVTVAAGESKQVSVIWDTKGERGKHDITAVADPENVVSESDESNNKSATTITIR